MGTTKQGPFEIPEALALQWLAAPNPHGRPNSDILVPWINGMAVTKRTDSAWIIDFFEMGEQVAARYEAPFAYVDEHVRKARAAKPRDWYRAEWWQHYAQRPEMRGALAGLDRFIVTPRVAKHRLFAWQSAPTNPDCQLIVFTRSDDLFFGVLHSRFHEVWALRMGTRLETRPRYTPTTCFETFPFPSGVIPEPRTLTPGSPLAEIAAAAKELNDLRERWLNPPEWTHAENLEFPASDEGPWRCALVDPQGEPLCVHESGEGWTPRDLFEADRSVRLASEAAKRGRGVATARLTRLVARNAACAARLKTRTLTKLYNARPAWLANCHAALDAAVAAAYGWPANLTDEEILERLLELNLAANCSGKAKKTASCE